MTKEEQKTQVLVYPELLTSLARAPSVIQTDLLKFATKFTKAPHGLTPTGPKSPTGLTLYELNTAWSVVAAFPRDDLALLLYASWTRSATEWAATHEIVPAGGGAYMAISEIVDLFAAAEEEPEPVPPLLKDVTDQQLLGIGLPAEKLPLVRSFTTKEELEASRSALPAETFKSLVWYVGGAAWTAVKREYEKVHHVLESQIGKMRVYLNPEQRKLVDGPWTHAVLVQGGAGSGKSVVAMHRAKRLVELPDWTDGDRLLFVTATKNLAVDIEGQLKSLVRSDRISQIEVTDLDGWVMSFLRRNSYKPSIVHPSNRAYKKAWKDALEALPRGVTEAEAKEEFERVILASSIRTLKTYLNSQASSRTREEREALWPVFETFRRELFNQGKVAPADAYSAANGLITGGNPNAIGPYRAVVADEIQDFGPEALKLIRALAPNHDRHPELERIEGDLFLVGDTRERIYEREVSYEACGINVGGGRTKRLSKSYRTTAEIYEAANVVLNGGEASPAGNEGAANRHGDEPCYYVGREFEDEVSWIVRQIHRLIDTERDMPLSSIVVAARTDSLLDDYQDALTRRGLRTLQISRNVPDDPNAAGVRSATLYRLKGLEFRTVFIVGADEGNIPDAVTMNEAVGEDEKKEAERAERALFHVAATRAAERLFVSCSDTPGEFLTELINHAKNKAKKA